MVFVARFNYKVCQMLPLQTKNSSHSWVTEVVALCSVYQASFDELNFTLLAIPLSKLAFYAWYFFPTWSALQTVQTISRINNIFKLANSVENRAGKVRLCLYDGAWYTEHNDTTIVSTPQILMDWADFSIHGWNIWQTSPRLPATSWMTSRISVRDVTSYQCEEWAQTRGK